MVEEVGAKEENEGLKVDYPWVVDVSDYSCFLGGVHFDYINYYCSNHAVRRAHLRPLSETVFQCRGPGSEAAA